MCGRYSLTEINKIFRIYNIRERKFIFEPRYNLAPSQDAPVIVEEDGRKVVMMRWGLIPHWAKEPSIGYKMINARAETVVSKPSFRRPFQKQRCLVAADSFYEWKVQDGKKKKTPFRILMKNEEPFVFAGLWDSWKKPDGELLKSFTIITTNANDFLKPIHDRMPVILKKEDTDKWLDPNFKDVAYLEKLLVPYPENQMKTYEISPLVNSPKNNVPEVIQPVMAQ
jgi:putative SOS response-associated peptidase YedK